MSSAGLIATLKEAPTSSGINAPTHAPDNASSPRSLLRYLGGEFLVPPRQHSTPQLHGIRETLGFQQPDRGYASVGTQANGDDRFLRIEFQRPDPLFQAVDGYIPSA